MRSRGKKRGVLLLLLTVCFIMSAHAGSNTADSLQQQITSLRARLEKLEKEREKSEKQNALEALLSRARTMSETKRADDSQYQKFHSGLRQQSALNPNISVGGDFYFATGSSRSELNRLPSDFSYGTGRFFLREMELGIQSALDPFSRGKVIFSFGREGVELEEGYVEWLNCPLNLNLKIGEFKTQFGKLNRYHDHALPQFDKPLVMARFFSLEGLKGFGLGGNFLLPRLWSHVNELDVEVITGGTGQSFTCEGKHNIITVMHVKNYYDLSRASYLEIGFSGAFGRNDPAEQLRSIVAGVDLTYKWVPPERAKYTGLEWRTEAMFSHRETPDDPISAWGFFSSLQYHAGARIFLSGRVDYTRLPQDSDLWEKGGALAVDYWQSEFVFVRLQYTCVRRNFDEDDHRWIIQTCWAMGPHKHEAY